VLRALGLGDLLTAIPALRGLARAFPDHERLLAAPAPLAPLVPPELAALVPTGELEPLPRRLERPHVAVNLHGRGPRSHELLLRARPGRMLAFEHPDVRSSLGGPRWRPREHEPKRWCRMLAESGVPANPAELDLEPPDGDPPIQMRGATMIHPGAASGARRWPARRFAAVARAERTAGRDVVISGGRHEVGLAFEVAAGAGLAPRHVIAGRTDLAGLASAVAVAGRVVCGDTGVAHLATALGTPSVVLFGPVSPAEWGPPAERSRHRVLWVGASGDAHADQPDPGLLAITVTDVLAALEELPAGATAIH
jgi:ADP-heptose:LPS heptosyltransferase